MVFNREQSVCFGRAFTPGTNGFMEKFKAWVVRAPAAVPVAGVTGGPGFFVIDDQSGLAADPYIVVSNHSAADVANFPNWYPDLTEPHKILKIGFVTATAGEMYIITYLWWNTTTHAGYGLYGQSNLTDVDSGNFVYDFRGGPNFMSISSRIGVTWYNYVMNDFVGDAVLLEDATHIGAVQNPLLAGTNVLIQLATGEAANFTAGKYYYIYDFTATLAVAPRSATNYTKIISVNTYTDQIVVEQIRYNYPVGSVIGSYPHRIFTLQTHGKGGINFKPHRIPYCSIKSTNAIWYNAVSATLNDSGVGCDMDANYRFLAASDPDDENFYLCEMALICEATADGNNANYNDQNRAYGIAQSVAMTSPSGIAQMLDGRLIGGLQYIYIYYVDIPSRIALLVPDFDSIV